MSFKLVTVALALVQFAAAMPAITLEDLELADDTMSVGSYIRETRAAAPQNYHKSYENEGDGEIGYSRKKAGGGKKGYQHFDSFHKKAGDHYEFEKQDSYGHDEGQEHGAHSHNHERIAQKDKYRQREPESEDIDEDEHRGSKNKQRREEHPHHEELKEGAEDGNGGVEAIGHDPADYVLPEKYTYGSGEEYNF